MTDRSEMMRRQRVLADFGDFVLDHEDLDEILNEGCRLIAEALGADLAKVLEIDHDTKTALVRAGIGWRPGIVGHERISLSEQSSEAYALEKTESVITNDIAREERFAFPPFLRDHGVVALVNVPILLPGRRPWGLLQVDAREAREFDDEDIEFLKTYAMVLGPVIDRLRVAAEREQAQSGLVEREEQLRLVTDAMPGLIAYIDAGLCYRFANKRYGEWFGLAPEEVNGRPLREVVGDAAFESLRPHAEIALAGQRHAFEAEIAFKTGGTRHVQSEFVPDIRPDGSVAGYYSLVLDVSSRTEAELALRESEERLRNAIEVGRLGLWDWNVVSGEVHWSDEHFRMEGYAVGEVKPSYEAWASRVHPDDRPSAEGALQHAMDRHEEFAHEFRVVHPNGSVHWLSGRGRFFYDDGGRAVRMIGAMVDTTERREWEERQQVLVAELQHRTRNLMGVVRSMADKTARASADLTDFRNRFRDRLEALSRVQGLLSRLNEHDRVTFDELIEAELAALGTGAARVELDGPKGVRLRSSTVQTLAMALHELATNAVKYGALGQAGAHLSVTWCLQTHEGEDRPWLHIDWRESGVEMPPLDSKPRGGGQGRELIERALPYQLSARTSYTLGPDGVQCTISIPVSATLSPGSDHV